MGGGGGWEEKWGLKLTLAKVEVEVEAELGNMTPPPVLVAQEAE